MGDEHDPEAALRRLGVRLPDPPAPAASYLPARDGAGLVFLAGQLPVKDGSLAATGRLGQAISTEEGAELAGTAAVNVLALARAVADGDLRRVRMLKVTVFVASDDGFTEQHLVANGASELLAEVLGEAGRHARSAVGVTSLPLGSPVEVEAIIEVRD